MAYRAYRAHQTSRLTEVTHSEHNERPMITLPNGSRFGLTFDLIRATAILQHIEAIQEFVETDGRGPVSDSDYRVENFMGQPMIGRSGFTATMEEAKIYLAHLEELRNFTGWH